MFIRASRQEVPEHEPTSERSFGIIPIRVIPDVKDTTGKLNTTNTEVLLIQQKTIIRGQPLFWSFPKGHAECGDKSEIDTAIREVREETGIVVTEKGILFEDVGPLMERYRNPVRGWVKEVRYWVALVDGQGEAKLEVQQAELADARWLSWKDALEILTFEKGKELLRRAMELLDRKEQDDMTELKPASPSRL